MAIKLDQSALTMMSLFEKITHVAPKDFFIDNQEVLIFVVNGNIARAIGKNGANVKRLEHVLKRKIKIVEFNPNIQVFVQNLVKPLKLHSVSMDDSTILVEAADNKTRGLLIGRAAQNLRNYEFIIKRYFKIAELKVP